MDFSQRIREHQSLVAEVTRLQERIEREREARLAALPAEFGYESVDDFIRALRAAAGGKFKPARPAAPRVKPAAAPAPATTPAPAGMHAAKSPAPAAAPVSPSAPVSASAPAPAAPALPSGTSLDDPANFGVLPDLSVLERAALTPALHRERMAEALRFATRVLHTPKVVAAVWREWRQFERRLHERLAETAG